MPDFDSFADPEPSILVLPGAGSAGLTWSRAAAMLGARVVPVPDRPTVPNAGFLRYEPGAGFPLHKHDFAQVWYVIDGEFQMGDRKYGPGTLVYMEDPHFEHEMRTETGGTVLFVQYPGPTTGARPRSA